MNEVVVALAACRHYEAPELGEAVRSVLDASGFAPSAGSVVLVKPNLLRAEALACTHPLVVREACCWLLERGVRVRVGDSPGFGTARGVARQIGLDRALAPLGLQVEPLGGSVRVALGRGGSWPVSRLALEADAILSVPRVKAHAQLGLTLAVKNLFGCVPGLSKAVAHTRQGHVPGAFTAGLVDLLQALPPVAGLADGVVAMHVTGPGGGQPFALGCLGASRSVAALDTVFYSLVGAQPHELPLWAALQERGLAGAKPEEVRIVGANPDELQRKDFVRPRELMDISFRPRRLLWSLLRRLWLNLRMHMGS